MTDQSVELSIVIPVYGAADCLLELQQRMDTTLKEMAIPYEIIYVDDRSPDTSWGVLNDIAGTVPEVRAFRLSRNFGQHAAITAGLSHARGQWVVVMDCDLQDPPETIPHLYAKGQLGYDVVLARRGVKRHSFFRRLAADLYFRLLNYIIKKPVDGDYGSFSLISRKVVDAYLRVPDINRHYLFILYWLGFKTTDIEYEHAERFAGESSYTFRKLLRHAATGLFFQTTTLLRWIVYLGFATSALGLTAAIYFVYRYLTESALPGWTSLAVLILGLGGIILISLGIVGLYIGQIFEQARGRPLYVIDEVIDIPS